MSPARRLTWLPASIYGEIAAQAERLLSDWAAAWSVPAPSPVQCSPIPAGADEGLDFVDLLAELPSAWKQSLARAIFKFDVHGSRLAEGVVQRVIAALQQRLREAFGEEASSADEAGPLGERGVKVSLEILGQRCGFVLTCSQLRASGRLTLPLCATLPPVNFEHALAATPVPLVAELGRADISVDELLQLTPGDVLLLRESLDAPLRVSAPGSSLVLPAHLGAISTPPQRAARWLAS